MAVKSYALTVRQRCKDFADISANDDTTNNVIDRMIDTITEFIENYCGRRFKKTAYTNEEMDSFHKKGEFLFLKHYPVITTESFDLDVRTSGLNEDDWDDVDSEYYFINAESGIVEAAGNYRFVRGRRKYRASYTAGFDFDNSSIFLSDTEAGDVELAAWMLFAVLWNTRRGGVGVEQERIGRYMVKMKKAVMEDPDLRAILDKYSKIESGATMTVQQT